MNTTHETPTVFRRHRGSKRLVVALLSVVGAVMMLLGATSSPASAAQPTGGPYAPEDHRTYIQGWVSMDPTCNALACHTYIKLERRNWYGGGDYMNGGWISGRGGWSQMTSGKAGGCQRYRTVVEVYTDVAGSYGGGINVGPIGVSANGTKMFRFKNTYASGWALIC